MELDQNSTIETKRPAFLSVLCILSFVWIGISILGQLITFISGPQSEEQLLEAKAALYQSASQMKEVNMDTWADFFRKMADMSEATNNNFYLVGITSFIILLVGLFGVISMWKMKKLGFHIYIVYSLLAVGQFYFFVSASMVPTVLVGTLFVISGIFVLLYALNVKHLK